MANFTPNRIYTYIRKAILDVYPTMYVTGGYEPIPPQGEAVRVHEISHYRPVRGICLDHEDEQWKVAFDVNVYSNKFDDSYTDVYDIMRVVEIAFKQLHFIEYECVPVERANNRVSRLTARFERQIGEGDQMPTGATGST